MRESYATVAGRGQSDGMADIPLPIGMQTQLIAVMDVVAKLHEIVCAQDCLPIPKNLGRAVFPKAMLAHEPATHALLFDVAAALGDQRSKDETIVSVQCIPLCLEYLGLVLGAVGRFFREPPSHLREHGIFIDRWLRVDDECSHRAL